MYFNSSPALYYSKFCKIRRPSFRPRFQELPFTSVFVFGGPPIEDKLTQMMANDHSDTLGILKKSKHTNLFHQDFETTYIRSFTE